MSRVGRRLCEKKTMLDAWQNHLTVCKWSNVWYYAVGKNGKTIGHLRVGKLRRNYERAVVRKVGWVASEQKWLRVDHALVWLRVENTLDALRRWVIMPWSEGVLCVCKGCYALMMGMRWYIRRVTERETCVSRLFVDGALGICITPSRDYALLSPAPKVFIE